MPKNSRVWILGGVLAIVIAYYFYSQNTGSKEDFLAFINGIAPEIEERYGIKPIITVTQGSLESDYGQSGLASEGRNIFGIKANPQWLADGKPTWTGATEEFYGGSMTPTKIRDTFKAYPSWRASVLDWAELISGPYKTAYRYAQAGDLIGYGNAIVNTGYSTDPYYPTLLAQTANDIDTMQRTA